MKKLLSLCAVMVLGFGSVAIAGGISSTDAHFLFGNDQIVAATISDVEMEQTQGQLAIILPPIPFTLPTDLNIGVDLIENPPVLGATVKDGLLDLGIAANVVENSVLGATVEEGILGGGIAVPLMALATPFMAMSSEMPFDPSMLTDLLGEAVSGIPVLSDLWGGGLATQLLTLAQTSPINDVNDLSDLINSLGLINLELFKGDEIIDLDVIPLDLLGGAGGVPFDTTMLTDLLDPTMLTDLLGGAGGVPTLDPNMLNNLLGMLPLESTGALPDISMLTDLLGGAGGVPTLDPSMLTDLLSGSGLPLDTSMLTDLLGGAGGMPDVSMLTDLLSGNSGNALVGVIGVLPL